MVDPITAGLLVGGIPLAIEGVAALTPQAREARKLNKRRQQEALRTLEHGKKHGFGPSAAKRTQQVTRRMRDYDRQMAPAQDTLARQESLLGLGRSGTVQEQRGQLAGARGNVLGQTRSMVENEARAIGEQRRMQAEGQLAQERGIADQRRQQALGTVSGAIQGGLSAGFATKQANDQRELQESWHKLAQERASVGDFKPE